MPPSVSQQRLNSGTAAITAISSGVVWGRRARPSFNLVAKTSFVFGLSTVSEEPLYTADYVRRTANGPTFR